MMPVDVQGLLIPTTLAITLLGALATFMSSNRNSRLVALVASLPALAVTSVVLWKTGLGPVAGQSYLFYSKASWIPSIGAHLEFGVDGLSASLAWLTAVLTPLVILYSWHENSRPRLFFALLVLMDATVMGVFTALDLFLFYIFWEFVLIPMYFLIAIWGGPNRKYASTKFFLYTGTASLIMLVGFMAVYFGYGLGTFSMPEITAHAAALRGIGLLAFGLLAVGFLVKMPSAPFHTWLPDAHVQAPTAGSVILAGVLLKMGSYGLMRIAIPMLGSSFTILNHVAVGPVHFDWSYQWVFFVLGAVSVVYGAFLCLAQDDLKSLIAYSSVSHMGLITIALATMTPLGFAGAAFMNIAHGIISAGMFMAAGSLQHATGTRSISKLGGIAVRVPKLTGLTATLFLASLGLPGLMGFIAEFTIFAGIWQHYQWLILIPIWSILITAGYYLWALQRGFYGPEVHHADVDWDHMHDVPRTEKWSMAALIGLALLFGILPGLLMGQMNDWTGTTLALLGVH